MSLLGGLRRRRLLPRNSPDDNLSLTDQDTTSKLRYSQKASLRLWDLGCVDVQPPLQQPSLHISLLFSITLVVGQSRA